MFTVTEFEERPDCGGRVVHFTLNGRPYVASTVDWYPGGPDYSKVSETLIFRHSDWHGGRGSLIEVYGERSTDTLVVIARFSR